MQPARLLILLIAALLLVFSWARWQQQVSGSVCPTPAAGSVTRVGQVPQLEFGDGVGLHGWVTQVITSGPDSTVSGFWLQDDGDGDPLTSDGIFVHTASGSVGSDFESGDAVLVSGRVSDYFGQLQVNRVTQLLSCGEQNLTPLKPVSLTLPEDGVQAAPLEQYTGMLVTFEQELTVSQAYFLGRYGQVSLSAGGRLFHPGSGHGAVDDRNRNRLLVLDDASSSENPDLVPFVLADGSVVRAGYTVSGLTGVLDHGLTGSGTVERGYRLQATEPVVFNPGGNPRAAAPAEVGGDVIVAAFNVENWFTTLGERGARTRAELERQQVKLLAALMALDADVISLIEIENDAGHALDALLGALNAQLPVVQHYVALPDVPWAQLRNRDAIRVALIYRPAVVTTVGAALVDTAGVHNRPPLAQAFSTRGGEVFSVVAVHFKSKGSCAASDPDRGEGCWSELRTRQAQALLQFIREQLQPARGPDVLITGDLNSYAQETSLQTLVDAGFVDLLLEHVPAEERYTYVFSPGYAGYLDYLLASPALAERVSGVSVWHINADEPEILGYAAARYGPDLFEPTPLRSSDHDPLLLGLRW